MYVYMYIANTIGLRARASRALQERWWYEGLFAFPKWHIESIVNVQVYVDLCGRVVSIWNHYLGSFSRHA